MTGQTSKPMSLAPHTIGNNPRTLGQKPIITRQDHPMGVLLRVLLNGPVQLYRYHFYNGHGVGPSYYPTGSSSTSGSTILIKKLNELPVDIGWWNFSLRSAEFFKEDSLLAQDLRARRYAARDIRQVVQRYNAWYATQPLRMP